MTRTKLLLPLLLLSLSCTPPKRGKTCLPPPKLDWNAVPPPFEGKLLVGSFEVPFKYYPSKDRMVFPLTFVGFVEYRNKTLRLGGEKLTFPTELWRLLSARLLGPDCRKRVADGGYRFTSKPLPHLTVSLLTDGEARPLEAEVCNPYGCAKATYRRAGARTLVEVEKDLRRLLFSVPTF
ncbi:MAG: hypothetical protein GXO08_02915 [Aquificae bacterium]|nr:hypothetical protein [Aquificota bacterium]